MSKAPHRLVTVFVNVALANNALAFLTEYGWILREVGELPPVYLLLPLVALLSTLFFMLHLARVPSKRMRMIIETLTHFLLSMCSPILIVFPFLLANLNSGIPWYWWTILGYLIMSGVLSLVAGLLLSREERQVEITPRKDDWKSPQLYHSKN